MAGWGIHCLVGSMLRRRAKAISTQAWWQPSQSYRDVIGNGSVEAVLLTGILGLVEFDHNVKPVKGTAHLEAATRAKTSGAEDTMVEAAALSWGFSPRSSAMVTNPQSPGRPSRYRKRHVIAVMRGFAVAIPVCVRVGCHQRFGLTLMTKRRLRGTSHGTQDLDGACGETPRSCGTTSNVVTPMSDARRTPYLCVERVSNLSSRPAANPGIRNTRLISLDELVQHLFWSQMIGAHFSGPLQKSIGLTSNG